MNAAAAHAFTRVAAGGDAAQMERRLAVEMPIAVEFGGVGYAVLMASPCADELGPAGSRLRAEPAVSSPLDPTE